MDYKTNADGFFVDKTVGKTLLQKTGVHVDDIKVHLKEIGLQKDVRIYFAQGRDQRQTVVKIVIIYTELHLRPSETRDGMEDKK
jgi:hypothetical protein